MDDLVRGRGWATVAAWRRHARRLKTATVGQGSLGTNVVYTPGRLGGWPGPERWAITRAGAHVSGQGVYKQPDD